MRREKKERTEEEEEESWHVREQIYQDFLYSIFKNVFFLGIYSIIYGCIWLNFFYLVDDSVLGNVLMLFSIYD